MNEEHSPELVDDTGAAEHRVLWAEAPNTHPSSHPPRRVAPAERSRTLLAVPRVAGGAKRALDPRLILLSEPDSARSASFRMLRDNLVAKGLPRILAVTSATRHEGKTTCALNLALALAEQSPGRVLLVDGNFFLPALAGIFSVDQDAPVEATPHLPWVAPFKLCALASRLHVATIVPGPNEPRPRLDKRRFGLLLARLCSVGYEQVIIDGPALEGSPSVAELLGAADGILLAVRAGRTTARALRRSIAQIAGEKALGIALIDAEQA